MCNRDENTVVVEHTYKYKHTNQINTTTKMCMYEFMLQRDRTGGGWRGGRANHGFYLSHTTITPMFEQYAQWILGFSHTWAELEPNFTSNLGNK